VPIATLKRRSEFLKVRGGKRHSTPAFLLEGRPAADGRDEGLRLGYTVTKKLGPAVTRNRMRRRLRSAVAIAGVPYASLPFDCVMLARPPALDRKFELLVADVASALAAVTRASGAVPRGGPA
jgi:ribonuclease P protein component